MIFLLGMFTNLVGKAELKGTCEGSGVKAAAWWLIWKSGMTKSTRLLQGCKKKSGGLLRIIFGLVPYFEIGLFPKSIFLVEGTVVYRLVRVCRAVKETLKLCFLLGEKCFFRKSIYQYILLIFRLVPRLGKLPIGLPHDAGLGYSPERYKSWKEMQVSIYSCISQRKCRHPWPPLTSLKRYWRNWRCKVPHRMLVNYETSVVRSVL